MSTIVIVDYGMGNLRSVQKAFEKIGAQAEIHGDANIIARADRIVLPGVGAFADAIVRLRERQLVPILLEHAQRDRPFLGICLGLQLLFQTSREDGLHEGLGILAGEVVRFDPRPGVKVPHMGWNSLRMRAHSELHNDVPDCAMVYFVHSYFAVPSDPAIVAAETEYPTPFASSIRRGRLFATQFHPEKSQAVGLTMLRNFARMKS